MSIGHTKPTNIILWLIPNIALVVHDLSFSLYAGYPEHEALCLYRENKALSLNYNRGK